MDLLEYMRSQDNMTQAEWERTSRKRNGEILVLLAGGSGAGKRNGFWASRTLLSVCCCATGALHVNQGRLVYPLSDEQYAAGNVLGRFPEQVIYRVRRARRSLKKCPRV